MIHMKKKLVKAIIRVCSNLFVATNPVVARRVQALITTAVRAVAIITICVIGLIINTLIACSPVVLENQDLDNFAAAFRAANQAKDIKPMLELYATNGIDKEQLTALKGALEYELGLPIESINFQKFTNDTDARIDYMHQGVSYGPSLAPKILMQVQYSTDDRFMSRFTIGQTETGSWRIICARPKSPTLNKYNH